jgi:hypothetical protein
MIGILPRADQGEIFTFTDGGIEAPREIILDQVDRAG